MATYRVHGEAHGSTFDESFDDEREATDYASLVIDGDVDSTIQVERVDESEHATYAELNGYATSDDDESVDDESAPIHLLCDYPPCSERFVVESVADMHLVAEQHRADHLAGVDYERVEADVRVVAGPDATLPSDDDRLASATSDELRVMLDDAALTGDERAAIGDELESRDEPDDFERAMIEQHGQEAFDAYVEHQRVESERVERECGDVLVYGPAHDPYETSCDLDKGHGSAHEGLDALDPSGETRIAWTPDGRGAGRILPATSVGALDERARNERVTLDDGSTVLARSRVASDDDDALDYSHKDDDELQAMLDDGVLDDDEREAVEAELESRDDATPYPMNDVERALVDGIAANLASRDVARRAVRVAAHRAIEDGLPEVSIAVLADYASDALADASHASGVELSDDMRARLEDPAGESYVELTSVAYEMTGVGSYESDATLVSRAMMSALATSSPQVQIVDDDDDFDAMEEQRERYEHVREVAERVVEALDDLRAAIDSERDVDDALRGGGASGALSRAPYETRNLLPDLEGREGGWLQGEGESFRESVVALAEWQESAVEDVDGS